MRSQLIKFENWFLRINKYKWANCLVFLILTFELIFFKGIKTWIFYTDVVLAFLNGIIPITNLYSYWKSKPKHRIDNILNKIPQKEKIGAN